MGKTIWRYTLNPNEQKLWIRDDMKGWCKAFVGWVEDEAREQGLKKYVIYDRTGEVIAKNAVSQLVE